MENSLGLQLFVRSTRRVELTPAAGVFLGHSRELIAKLDEAVLNTRIAAGGLGEGGDLLTIGAISPATSGLLPLILGRFRRRFPDTRLEVTEVDSTLLLRGIESGEFHVGLMRPPVSSNSLRFRLLFSERFVAVIPRLSPLAQKPHLRLADFVGHGVFALKRFELSSFETVWQQLVEAGLLAQGNVSVSDTTSALALVMAGVGITFLPEWVAGITDGGFTTRYVEDLVTEIPMAICWKAECPVPGILPFVEYAVLAAQSLASERRRPQPDSRPASSATS